MHKTPVGSIFPPGCSAPVSLAALSTTLDSRQETQWIPLHPIACLVFGPASAIEQSHQGNFLLNMPRVRAYGFLKESSLLQKGSDS